MVTGICIPDKVRSHTVPLLATTQLVCGNAVVLWQYHHHGDSTGYDAAGQNHIMWRAGHNTEGLAAVSSGTYRGRRNGLRLRTPHLQTAGWRQMMTAPSCDPPIFGIPICRPEAQHRCIASRPPASLSPNRDIERALPAAVTLDPTRSGALLVLKKSVESKMLKQSTAPSGKGQRC